MNPTLKTLNKTHTVRRAGIVFIFWFVCVCDVRRTVDRNHSKRYSPWLGRGGGLREDNSNASAVLQWHVRWAHNRGGDVCTLKRVRRCCYCFVFSLIIFYLYQAFSAAIKHTHTHTETTATAMPEARTRGYRCKGHTRLRSQNLFITFIIIPLCSYRHTHTHIYIHTHVHIRVAVYDAFSAANYYCVCVYGMKRARQSLSVRVTCIFM